MKKSKIAKPIAGMTLAELEKAIRRHNDLYFKKAKPEISDEEFDRMVERLKELKPTAKVLEEIGSDLNEAGKKIEHSSPMLSLDKCYNLEDLAEWAAKLSDGIVASPKIDGLAIAIHYDAEGRLFQAETRGDGFKGEDISLNVLEIQDVPRQIEKKLLLQSDPEFKFKISQNQKGGKIQAKTQEGTSELEFKKDRITLKSFTTSVVEVRGEVYMRKSVFKRYASSFANPRNLAAGALKQKDPQKTKEYELSFFAYEVTGRAIEEEIEKVRWLKKLGFTPIDTVLVTKEPEALEKSYQGFLKGRDRLDYELDGVVYKANSVADQVRLGASAHHPRWAIAYKFQGDSGTSVLREVEWSVSRTRAITPIGIIDPVRLSGATVSRVSLHNYGLMKKMGVSIGAQVLVMRRGGVIPNLEEVIKPTKQVVEAPKKCPSCGFPTEIKDDFLYCSNLKGCRSTKVGELRHFVDVLEIEGFGEKMLEQLYDNGFVEDLPDFYRLSKDDILSLDRTGEILATKLIDHIQSRRKIPLALFLRSLGIPELAKSSSQLLVKNFRTLEKVRSVSEEELAEIHGIGPVIAREVVRGLKEKAKTIDKLLKEVTLDEKSAAKAGKLSGKSFLFTGKMATMDRGAAEKSVEAQGGEIATGVSKDLDYLVIGSEGYKNREKGNKWLKAEALMQKGAGLKIISEEDFLAMLE